jgi:hypothetical protein
VRFAVTSASLLMARTRRLLCWMYPGSPIAARLTAHFGRGSRGLASPRRAASTGSAANAPLSRCICSISDHPHAQKRL